MMHSPKQAIAILSIDSKPNDSKLDTLAIHHQLAQLTSALRKAGWQIDRFLGKVGKSWTNQVKIERNSPDSRKIYITATNIAQFVREFQKFAMHEGGNYPLIHTWNGLAGQIGLQLKVSGGMQWIHSYWSEDSLSIESQISGHPSAQTAWQIWHNADEIIEFASLNAKSSPFHPKVRSKIEAKRQLGLSAFDTVILWVGTFAQQGDRALQEIERWLEIATRLNQMSAIQRHRSWKQHWVFIAQTSGSADDRAQINRAIQEKVSALDLKDKIHWSASGSPEGLDLYYSAADACVLPNWREPFADKALRAIDRGTPAIASQDSGARFAVIPKETGLRVAANSPEAWAEAIAQVLEGDRWVKRLWQHSLGRSDPELSWTIAAAHLSEVYRRLLAQTITQIPLWHSQKPYSIRLPQRAMVTDFEPDKTLDFVPSPASDSVAVAAMRRSAS
ncbi:MAG: glycosyltransferase [Hydrococcus sp. C42_A2020_068]|nr:glycosyltransferase [Hydrococcus sp. C42_A2020_068]